MKQKIRCHGKLNIFTFWTNIWVDWTIERNDLGNDQREDVAPHLGAPWGSGEQRVKLIDTWLLLKPLATSGRLKGVSFLCCESKRWLVCRDSLFSVLLHSVILTKEAYSLLDKLTGTWYLQMNPVIMMGIKITVCVCRRGWQAEGKGRKRQIGLHSLIGLLFNLCTIL